VPSPEVVKRALDEIRKRPANYEYFFDRLESPDWIEPLLREGLFQHPPPPEQDGGYIRFPFWPESRYLARMAPLAPEAVLNIILNVETDNVRVHEDFANAACAMPPTLAARWARKEAQWVRDQQHLYLLLPGQLGDLVLHLARGGQVDAALDLTRSLLAVLPDPKVVDAPGKNDEAYLSTPKPRGRFDDWDYQQILEKCTGELVTVAGVQAFKLLCNLLDDAVRYSRSSYDFESTGDYPWDDYLYIQRPAIEEHRQNQSHGIVDSLISAVRDAADQIATGDPTLVRHLIQMLEERGWKIFHRLALYLLWRFPEAAPELVAERLADRKRFDDTGLRHEYALLAQKCFATLSDEDQERILSWIEEGPNIDLFKTRREAWEGSPPSDEEAARYANLWRRDRLALFSADLPEEWRRRYDELVAEFGPAEHPEFVSYMGAMWVGPTSPKTAEDLRSMSIEEIVRYLGTWRPSGDLMSPSPEGLGRELANVIASDPEPFAVASSDFQGLDPTYVRSFFSGLQEAAKQGRSFPWPPVLDLCRWVLQQVREAPERGAEYEQLIEHYDLDPDWGWTRKAIADLISQGLEASDAQIPPELSTQVWAVLRTLTDDPDPTPEDEARFGGSNMDPATYSINTTRGEAVHGVVRYALWVRRKLEETSGEVELLARGFEVMPEVQEVLDHHLDPEVEPSPAIRAVYGRWFPQIVFIDQQWAVRNVARIFPSDENLRDLRTAAWGAYLIFCNPSEVIFNILSEEYGYAVEQLGLARSERWMPADPDERLAEHLMILYWRGTIDLNDPTNLLWRFYANASDTLRAHALDFLGRSLHNIRDEIPADTLTRLRALWESRLEFARDEPSSHSDEVAAFGWWFASGKFDNVWAMAQLKEALRLSGETEPYELVLERLATLSTTTPVDAVECLRLIMEGDKEGWNIRTWREPKRTILDTALKSGDPTAQQLAESLIHRLGARGYWDFRDLLRKPRNSTM
jgi:hypothetical protein